MKTCLPFVTIFLFIQISCTVTRHPVAPKQPLDTLWTSAVFANHHAGLALYDLDNQKTIYEHHSERYFVPASNTKLFTFYTGLKTLGDSVEALRYVVRNDSLIFWGTGDPTLLNINIPSRKALEFLGSRSEKLFYWPGNFQQDFFGLGWAWDDYNDYYQPELTAMPVYGNVIRFKAKPDRSLEITPATFGYFTDQAGDTFRIQRDLTENRFHGNPAPVTPTYEQHVPFRTSSELTVRLLQDTLKKPVQFLPDFSGSGYQTIQSVAVDTLYKHMLQPSDNFLAEQILLLSASKQQHPMESKVAIDYMLNTYLADLPDKPGWVDGSGLSRHNLFTPRSIVMLLQKLYREIPRERLFPLLAVGGQSGTLKSSYRPVDGKPYIFAKSGSLTGCYNLSGYLITKTGKTFIFSFMNNNFNRSTSDIRKEVERILTAIRERY
ncbi:MAG: D-alanyl-D-alanine carboxypeptidase [Siphonobacter sp.]